jgi:iron complex outermembrane receptor protein
VIFRQNSSYDRKSLTLQGQQKINAKGELSFIGIYTQLKAYIPSSINEDDFNNQAARNWSQAQAMNPMTTNHGRWLPPAIVLKMEL